MEIDEKINAIADKYMHQGKWKRVEIFIKPIVKRPKPNPLYLTYYSISLYQQYQYKEALKYSFKAISLNRKDPFIIYHHGIILMCNKMFKDAIDTWNELLAIPSIELFYGEYSDGIRWAKSLKNDTIYYIALTYFYMNDLAKSIIYYKKHLRSRKKGLPSFKTKKEVREELKGTVFLSNYEKRHPDKAKLILK